MANQLQCVYVLYRCISEKETRFLGIFDSKDLAGYAKNFYILHTNRRCDIFHYEGQKSKPDLRQDVYVMEQQLDVLCNSINEKKVDLSDTLFYPTKQIAENYKPLMPSNSILWILHATTTTTNSRVSYIYTSRAMRNKAFTFESEQSKKGYYAFDEVIINQVRFHEISVTPSMFDICEEEVKISHTTTTTTTTTTTNTARKNIIVQVHGIVESLVARAEHIYIQLNNILSQICLQTGTVNNNNNNKEEENYFSLLQNKYWPGVSHLRAAWIVVNAWLSILYEQTTIGERHLTRLDVFSWLHFKLETYICDALTHKGLEYILSEFKCHLIDFPKEKEHGYVYWEMGPYVAGKEEEDFEGDEDL